MCLAASGEPNRLFSHIWLDNLLSEQALFLLSRRAPGAAA
jgi:hypothetical protein